MSSRRRFAASRLVMSLPLHRVEEIEAASDRCPPTDPMPEHETLEPDLEGDEYLLERQKGRRIE